MFVARAPWRVFACTFLWVWIRAATAAYGQAGWAQPTYVKESCPRKVRRQRLELLRECSRHIGCEPDYNPLEPEHDSHCVFACLAHLIHRWRPTLSQTMRVRHAVAQTWEGHAALHEVASRAGFTPQQYLILISESLWGGIPDLQLLAEMTGLTFEIRNAYNKIMGKFGHGRVAHTLVWTGQHYMVMRARYRAHARPRHARDMWRRA